MTHHTESASRVEPCLLDEAGPKIDLVAALSGAAHALGGRLHPRSAAGLADLVRVMNCYYSNRIEGHNHHAREIEGALSGDLAPTEERRNLQIEARAHIRLQRAIDRQFAAAESPEPASTGFLLWLHRTFYQDAPEAMLLIAGAGRQMRMIPGTFRAGDDQQVTVGRHQLPSPGAVPVFMAHFERGRHLPCCEYEFNRWGWREQPDN